MGYLDKMNREVADDKDINVQFQIFFGIVKHDANNEIVHCFFEGEDSKYYISRINAEKNEKVVEIYDCKRKSNVLKLYNKIKRSMKSDNLEMLFFIDRDFEINPNYPNDIYVTECYAIENFYIKDSVMRDFISSEMNIRRSSIKDIDKEDYKRALEYFKSEREKFIENTKLLNAWYSLQNKKYNENLYKNPDLSELETIDVTKNIDLEYLKLHTKNYYELNEEELKNEIERLMKNPLDLFRGKYYAQFLVYIIKILVTKKSVDMHILNKTRAIKSNISTKNIISELSNYAVTPRSLKTYLNSRLNYVNQENVS